MRTIFFGHRRHLVTITFRPIFVSLTDPVRLIFLTLHYRTLSGMLQSTPIHRLPLLSHIHPPHLRREEAISKLHKKSGIQLSSTTHK